MIVPNAILSQFVLVKMMSSRACAKWGTQATVRIVKVGTNCFFNYEHRNLRRSGKFQHTKKVSEQ